MIHNFTRLLADLWNKIKRDSSALTLSISEDDIVVLYVQMSSLFTSIPDDESSQCSRAYWIWKKLGAYIVGSFPCAPGFISASSQFIKEATRGELVKSSRNYHPFTTKVQAIRCELTDEAKRDLQKEGVKSIVFVDTPSFLTEYDDIDAQKELRTWIDRTE